MKIPSAVSVVLDDPCAKPLQTLPVVSSAKSVRRKFTVCISPLFGSIGDKLIEWIEMNRILGAEFFVFYKSSKPEKYEDILTYYSKRDLVEVNLWNNPLDETLVHYNGQISAINDCILRHRFHTDFIALFDLDEFIIPRNQLDTTWHEMMERLPRASSYIFKSVAFPIQPDQQKMDKNNATGFKYKLDILNILKRGRNIDARRPKMILNPKTINSCGVHFVHEHSVGKSSVVPTDVGLVHHYREVVSMPLRKAVQNSIDDVTDTTVLKY